MGGLSGGRGRVSTRRETDTSHTVPETVEVRGPSCSGVGVSACWDEDGTDTVLDGEEEVGDLRGVLGSRRRSPSTRRRRPSPPPTATGPAVPLTTPPRWGPPSVTLDGRPAPTPPGLVTD